MTRRQYDTKMEFEADHPNVRGTGIGPNNEWVVFVSKKVPADELTEEELVPDELTIGGVTRKTDVSRVGIAHLTHASEETDPADHKKAHNPIPGGVSIGNSSVGAGTLGYPKFEHESGDLVGLTNSHVVGNSTHHYQPADIDGGREDVPFGSIREKSPLDDTQIQTTDSALIHVEDEKMADTILGIGEVAGFADATFSNSPYTLSARSGVNHGELLAVDVSLWVTYGPRTIRFAGCDVFSDMSIPGDSGGIDGYFDGDEYYITSLNFAGSDTSSIGIPLRTVQEYHGELSFPEDEEEVGWGGLLGRLIGWWIRGWLDIHKNTKVSRGD